MSLFGSIQNAVGALRASQIGLQVVGQNIANANTPGYIREEVNYVPAATQRIGGILLGLGVKVAGVVQKIDTLLEQRLRSATSDRANAEGVEQTFQQLEGLIGELGDTDLSTSMNNFFSSINEVLNQPESLSIRNLAVLKGKTLAQDINRLAQRVGELRTDVNRRVGSAVDNINRLTSQIRDLNIRIAQMEGGDTSNSDAVGLRDQRHKALLELASLIDIRAEEQDNGTVTVFTGGDYLVFQGQSRDVKAVQLTDRGIATTEIRLVETDAPLQSTSGELAGLIEARDGVLGGFLDSLNDFAGTLAFEFNKVYSQGQGINGFQELKSEFGVVSQGAALDEAGLEFSPVNGSFQVQILNRKTGLTKTTDIVVDLNGLDHDTTMTDLAAALNAIDGMSASVTVDGRLSLKSDSSDQEIAFANDTSGILAALGMNTFFSGTDALSIGINQYVTTDPGKFAASRGGVGEDTDNAIELASFLDRPLSSQFGASIGELYGQLTGAVTQSSAEATSAAEGFRVYETALNGQSLATSGVSLDEEAIKMMSYQRAYQASARYISTLNELLDVLINL